MRSLTRVLPALAVAAVALGAGAASAPAAEDGGYVYTETNAVAGNAIVVYDRAGNGRIRAAGSVATGGLGTGSGLGSQGALALAGDFLFAVDAGSDEVSVLDVAGPRPRLVERTPSGGLRPISVTVHDDLVYMLNAGGAGNITGFRVGGDGTLTRLSRSTRRLAGQNPAQVGFSPDGSMLLVTEKGSDTLDTYAVGHDGRAGQPVSNPSSGATPFGFAFDPRARVIVSDLRPAAAPTGRAPCRPTSSSMAGCCARSAARSPTTSWRRAGCW